jgi:hypothetical protein
MQLFAVDVEGCIPINCIYQHIHISLYQLKIFLTLKITKNNIMSTNNIHLIDDESTLKTLDEEISKKLKAIIKSSPCEEEELIDICHYKVMLRSHREFYYESLEKNNVFELEEINENNINLLMAKGIGKMSADRVKKIFESYYFNILKKEVREYVINQNLVLMFGGLHDNNFLSTTFRLNLTRPLKINSKQLFDRWSPKAFLTIHTIHFLDFVEQEVSRTLKDEYQLIQASLMINSKDDYYNNQHFTCLLPVIFRGLRKLGDSVLSCIVPIDGVEDSRIHAIPLSHHYENYGLLDESSSVKISLEKKKTILLMHGLFANAESSYRNLNYRLKLIFCKKDVPTKLVCNKFVEYINNGSLYFPVELISNAKEKNLIVASSPEGCIFRKKISFTPDEEVAKKRSRVSSNNDQQNGITILDGELVSNDEISQANSSSDLLLLSQFDDDIIDAILDDDPSSKIDDSIDDKIVVNKEQVKPRNSPKTVDSTSSSEVSLLSPTTAVTSSDLSSPGTDDSMTTRMIADNYQEYEDQEPRSSILSKFFNWFK